MNFDRLAVHYPWMEHVYAGGLMQRCRVAFLPQVIHCRRVLLLGEGTGKFLAELLRHNSSAEIVCVEQSRGMIRQMRRHLEGERLDISRVQFEQADALSWSPPPGQFDLIVTNFFLDCFRPEQLRRLIPALAGSAGPGATWLVADFRLPEKGWRRWRAGINLAVLYAFFKLSTSLATTRLTPPDEMLKAAGFELVERRLANFGFAHADCWRKKVS